MPKSPKRQKLFHWYDAICTVPEILDGLLCDASGEYLTVCFHYSWTKIFGWGLTVTYDGIKNHHRIFCYEFFSWFTRDIGDFGLPILELNEESGLCPFGMCGLLSRIFFVRGKLISMAAMETLIMYFFCHPMCPYQLPMSDLKMTVE